MRHEHDHDHFGHPSRRGRSPGGWRGMETGGGWGGGRRRMRRGDIRRAILAALLDGPAHGYEVMRRLEERTGGLWRPSPGSVYPTLQMLEDEGLVRAEAHDGTRTYELTERGRTEAETAAQAGGPWEAEGEGSERARDLRLAMVQVLHASKQLSHAGGPTQVERGVEVLDRARRELYQILAES